MKFISIRLPATIDPRDQQGKDQEQRLRVQQEELAPRLRMKPLYTPRPAKLPKEWRWVES